MEPPLMKASRLLVALDGLTEREGMYLRGGHYDLAAEARQRAEPIVHLLVELAELPEVRGLQPQVTAVVEKSASHAAFMRTKLHELDQEIRRNDRARFSTTKIIPAYTQAAEGVTTRFEAAG